MTRTGPDAALVLFSGGQDSTVCLAWALERFERVETVGFDYGQRHHAELAARERVRARMLALRPAWARIFRSSPFSLVSIMMWLPVSS